MIKGREEGKKGDKKRTRNKKEHKNEEGMGEDKRKGWTGLS